MSAAVNEIMLHVMDEVSKGNLVLSSMSTANDGEFSIEFRGVFRLMRDEDNRRKMREAAKGTVFEHLFKFDGEQS